MNEEPQAVAVNKLAQVVARIKSVYSEIVSIIKGGIIYLFSGVVLCKAIAMISSIVIARLISKESYASYTYANTIYSYIDLIAGFGLPTAILVLLPKVDNSIKNVYFRYALKRGLCIQVILTLLVGFAISCININIQESKLYVYMLSFMPIFTYILSLIQIKSRIELENKFYSQISVIQAFFVCSFGVVLTIYFNVEGMIIGRYLAIIFTVFIGLNHFNKLFKDNSNEILNQIEKTNFIRLGFGLFVANLFSTIMPINEIFLVSNLIKDKTVIANFRVAGIIPEQILLVTSILMTYYFPIIAKESSSTDLWYKIKKINIINIGLITVLGGIGILLTPMLIRLLYTNKYEDAIPLTFMLWSMRLINALIRMIPMNILPALGYTKFNAIVCSISCIVQTLLDYYLISTKGINGVVYATTSVYVISGLISWIYLYNICKNKLKKTKDVC